MADRRMPSGPASVGRRPKRAAPPVMTGILRTSLRSAIRLAEAAGGIASPLLLLAIRIWLSQSVLVHRIMAMMLASGIHGAPPTLDMLFQSIAPLLLVVGLFTQPVALILLLEAAWNAYAGTGTGVLEPRSVLLLWLLVMGAGPFSLDAPLRRGLSWIPFSPARLLIALQHFADRAFAPLLLALVRVSIAAAIAIPGIVALRWSENAMLGGATALPAPGWGLTTIAVALALGLATRFATMILCGMLPFAGIAAPPDHRPEVLLLLLLLAARGGGPFSFDRLIARWARGATPWDMMEDHSLPHVVVVGGGFGGVAAVRGLRNAACRITLIDQRNYHLFQPLLYQVATAALSPAEIATPIRSLFRGQRNVRVLLGEVTGADPTTRHVLLGARRIPFDYLILATGAQHSYFGQNGWAQYAPGLKTIEDATTICSRLLRAFEEAENAADAAERAAWLTFVVIGGGPTGVELAGALAELARHGLEREYRTIDPATARVILVQAGPRILPTFPAFLSAAAERSLLRLGVEVRLNARVLGVDAGGVDVGEQRIPARTILWAAGVAASPAARWLGRPGDAAGRLAVADDLSVPGSPRLYAIGDTASSRAWRGGPVPGLAPAAKQQGHYVARLIDAAIEGRKLPGPFRYRHFGSLATIGRLAAVAELGRLCIWGAPAWWFWGAAHIMFLVGGRNRMIVLFDWLWAYMTYRRGTRLITGEPRASSAA